MWCLETIIQLNNKAQERHDNNSHPIRCFKDVGCNVPAGTRLFPVCINDVINDLSNNPGNDSPGQQPPQER